MYAMDSFEEKLQFINSRKHTIIAVDVFQVLQRNVML